MNNLISIYKQNRAPSRDELRRWGCTGIFFDDLYHEAFLIFMEEVNKKGRSIPYPRAYITCLCRNLWFREQKRLAILDRLGKVEPEYDPEYMKVDKMDLFLYHLKMITGICKEILTLYALGYTENDISQKLHLPDCKSVNNKKQYCKEKLKNQIKMDPLFKEIYEEAI